MQTCKLLSNDTVLLSQPKLIEEFGRAGAQLLSQLHYWLTKKEALGCNNNGVRWIYNSADAWSEQLRISPRQVQRIVKKLTDLGVLLVEKLSVNKYNRTNHYAIDYDSLQRILESNASASGKSSCQPITTLCRNASGQDVAITIQKLPNKDFNKSERFEKNSEVVGQGGSNLPDVSPSPVIDETMANKQVEQVKNLKLKSKKVLEDRILAAVNETETLQIYGNPPILIDTVRGSTNEGVVIPDTSSVIKTSTAQDMIKIWNEFLSKKAEAKLSKSLAPMLVAAFKTKFESNLKNWQNYCEQLHSSSYLMADSFALTIAWALKFGTIDRIGAGDLGVNPEYSRKNRAGDVGPSKTIIDVKAEIFNLRDESPKATETRLTIMAAIGHAEYYSWFHQARFLVQPDGSMQITAPNAFVENIWRQRYDWVCAKGVEIRN